MCRQITDSFIYDAIKRKDASLDHWRFQNCAHKEEFPNKQIFGFNKMFTIVVKAFKAIPAIKRPLDAYHVHYENGIKIEGLLATIASQEIMTFLSDTYASIMPCCLTNLFLSWDVDKDYPFNSTEYSRQLCPAYEENRKSATSELKLKSRPALIIKLRPKIWHLLFFIIQWAGFHLCGTGKYLW